MIIWRRPLVTFQINKAVNKRIAKSQIFNLEIYFNWLKFKSKYIVLKIENRRLPISKETRRKYLFLIYYYFFFLPIKNISLLSVFKQAFYFFFPYYFIRTTILSKWIRLRLFYDCYQFCLILILMLSKMQTIDTINLLLIIYFIV